MIHSGMAINDQSTLRQSWKLKAINNTSEAMVDVLHKGDNLLYQAIIMVMCFTKGDGFWAVLGNGVLTILVWKSENWYVLYNIINGYGF